VLKGYQKNILQPKAECKNTVLQRELLIIFFAVFGWKINELKILSFSNFSFIAG
jgi:hypothetical protein